MINNILNRIKENALGAVALFLVLASLTAAAGLVYNQGQGAGPGGQVSAVTSIPVAPEGISVKINGGAAFSNSTEVMLTLTATGASECRYKNEEDPDWGAWEPYVSQKAWELSAGDDGYRVVAYQCRADAPSDIGLAKIAVDRTAPRISYSLEIGAGSVTADINVRELMGEKVVCKAGLGRTSSRVEIALANYSGGAKFVGAGSGEENFTLICYDEAGNAREAPPQALRIGNA